MRRLFLVLLILSFAAPAAAQQLSTRAGNWQISLQTRYTPTQEVDTDGGSGLETEDDIGWGFGFNYNINRRFSLGAGFTWRSVNYTATIVDADDPAVTEELYAQFDMSTAALTGNFYLFEGPLTPYVDGSFGWLLADSNVSAGDYTGCWWTPWGFYCTSFETTYGRSTWSGSLGVGARWEPGSSGNFFLKGGYEYGWTGEDLITNAHILKLEIGLLM